MRINFKKKLQNLKKQHTSMCFSETKKKQKKMQKSENTKCQPFFQKNEGKKKTENEFKKHKNDSKKIKLFSVF